VTNQAYINKLSMITVANDDVIVSEIGESASVDEAGTSTEINTGYESIGLSITSRRLGQRNV